MAYADYNYYDSSFLGRVIPAEDFSRFSDLASKFIDELTMNRIFLPVSEEIKNAACAVAEIFYEDAENGNVKSVNNDGYSVTFKDNSDVYEKAGKLAALYLVHTGLLYRGIK